MARRFFGSLLVLAFVLAPTFFLACAPVQAPRSTAAEPRRTVGGARQTSFANSDRPRPPARGRRVLLPGVPEEALGPRLISTLGGYVAVWGDPAGEKPGLYSVFVPGEGQVGEPQWLGPIDSSARQLQLGAGAPGRIFATLIRRAGEHEALSVIPLGKEGELDGTMKTVGHTASGMLFSKVVPSAHGAVLYWVERSGSAADLRSIVLDTTFAQESVKVASGISAWQIESSRAGVSIATREGVAIGTIRLRQMGDTGQTIGAPIELGREVRGGLDLDLAMTSERIVVGWSQARAFETQLVGMTLDLSGNIVTPLAPWTSPRGPQALVRLVGSESSDRVTVVWEEPVMRAAGRPELFFGQLEPKGRIVEAEHALVSARKDTLLPLFVRAASGLALITDSQQCHRPEPTKDACVPGETRRFAAIVGNEIESQIDLGKVGGPPVAMAWDLTCAGEECALLVADQGSPPQVSLRILAGGPAADGVVVPVSETTPRVTSNEALGVLPELTKLAVAEGGTVEAPRTLATWLSYFDPEQPYVVPSTPAPDGKLAPVRSVLTTQLLGAASPSKAAPSAVISYRARSLGGLSLVPPVEGRGLLVWSAVDAGDPQLFATIIDSDGKKLSQKMLTRTPGEVSDVAAIRVPGGYLVSWVDGRSGRSAVYAWYLSETLVPLGPERLVSASGQDPTGVELVFAEGRVLCVWADSRSSGLDGYSDLYLAALDPKTGEPLATEQKLTDSAGHAHSPRLSWPTGAVGPTLVWLNSHAEGKAVSAGGVMWADLDAAGKFRAPAAQVELPGSVSDISVACRERSCRAVAVVTGEDSHVSLSAIQWGEGLEPSSRALVPLAARAPEGVSPVLLGDRVYFADRDPEGEDWFLRRAEIDWGK